MMTILLHALFSLLVTLSLILGFIYLLKKYHNLPKRSSNGIQLVKQLALGNRERILVVEVEEVKLIIGISPSTFNTLHVIEKKLIEN